MLINSVSAEQVFVDGAEFSSLQEAKVAIRDGSQIYLKAGIYTQGLYIQANDISILGEKKCYFL
jgi:pectin methylesterase-like acyl-CoA thioesterase